MVKLIRSSLWGVLSLSSYLSAYLSVLRVFSQEFCVGAIFAIITVCDFPRNDSRRMCVSLLCRYGVCPASWSMLRIHSFNYIMHNDCTCHLTKIFLSAMIHNISKNYHELRRVSNWLHITVNGDCNASIKLHPMRYVRLKGFGWFQLPLSVSDGQNLSHRTLSHFRRDR